MAGEDSARTGRRAGRGRTAGTGGRPLCARVGPEARDLIERAAKTMGWSPSRLLRVAAVEKAAEILNLEGDVDFDFEGLARDLAGRLAASFRQDAPADSAGAVPPDGERTAPDRVERLEQAARYGGRAFLNLLVACVREATGGVPPARREAPVDPTRFL